MIAKLLRKIGLVRQSEINNKLDFARSVGKRLDEHRELVESIEEAGVFKEKFWHVGHMATQDDYLMRLYHIRHNQWPYVQEKWQATGEYEYIRPRPSVLGPCRLPEYSECLIHDLLEFRV